MFLKPAVRDTASVHTNLPQFKVASLVFMFSSSLLVDHASLRQLSCPLHALK